MFAVLNTINSTITFNHLCKSHDISRIIILLGIGSLQQDLQRSGLVFVLINLFSFFANNFLIISLTLFLIDSLSPSQVGLIWGLYFGVLAVFDYPTGALGDIIGHRNVFLLATFLKILASVVFIFEQSFDTTLWFMVLLGLGMSQESGAMSSWFDNKYTIEADDESRVTYSAFMARARIVWNTFSVLGLVLGGYVTSLLSLSALLIDYLVVLLMVFLLALLLMDRAQTGDEAEIGLTFRSYFGLIRESLTEFYSNRAVLFYMLGTAFLWAGNESIWHPLISIRLYRDYTGSIAGAGVFRSVLFVSVILWQVIVAKFIHHFSRTNFWIVLSSLVSNAIFFTAVMFYTILFPPIAVRPLLILGFFLIYQPAMFLESAEGILRQRVELDMIPNRYRNSLYSLMPTLARGLGGIFVFVGGSIIEKTTLTQSFLWLISVALVGTLILSLGLRRRDQDLE